MPRIKEKVHDFDEALIKSCQSYAPYLARVSIFVIYFWFGLLKVFSLSPANPLVASLLERTLPFISFESFIVLFGILEMTIGLVFLFPRLSRLAILFLVLHLVTTVMPLFLVPEATWQGFLVPTLEGQYIIKNILLAALAAVISAGLSPLKKSAESGENPK